MIRHALVTGGAGFIGSHLVERLLADGWRVTVADVFDSYLYPCEVKRQNIAAASCHPNCRLFTAALEWPLDVIVHLAARPGVRASLVDPRDTYEHNVNGTIDVLELARAHRVKQFIFASSSSVYGLNHSTPWAEENATLPISPYASSKLAGEQLGQVYSHLHGIRFTALRFFSVYGPRQRPDLALHQFAAKMLDGQPIILFGDGSSLRDYTHVSDVVAGIVTAMQDDGPLFDVFNLGAGKPVTLLGMLTVLQMALGVSAKVDWQPPQPGDVPQTWADISKAKRLLGYAPRVQFEAGVRRFVDWFQSSRMSGRDAVQTSAHA